MELQTMEMDSTIVEVDQDLGWEQVAVSRIIMPGILPPPRVEVSLESINGMGNTRSSISTTMEMLMKMDENLGMKMGMVLSSMMKMIGISVTDQ